MGLVARHEHVVLDPQLPNEVLDRRHVTRRLRRGTAGCRTPRAPEAPRRAPAGPRRPACPSRRGSRRGSGDRDGRSRRCGWARTPPGGGRCARRRRRRGPCAPGSIARRLYESLGAMTTSASAYVDRSAQSTTRSGKPSIAHSAPLRQQDLRAGVVLIVDERDALGPEEPADQEEEVGRIAGVDHVEGVLPPDPASEAPGPPQHERVLSQVPGERRGRRGRRIPVDPHTAELLVGAGVVPPALRTDHGHLIARRDERRALVPDAAVERHRQVLDEHEDVMWFTHRRPRPRAGETAESARYVSAACGVIAPPATSCG